MNPDFALDPRLRDLVARHFHWAAWEGLLAANGVVIERPYRSAHPAFPEIVYPIDYGFVPGTLGADGHEVDVFVGTAPRTLVGTMITVDHRRRDTEFKLLYGCTPEEIYLVNGFLNFDRALMEGLLVLRRPMRELWER